MASECHLSFANVVWADVRYNDKPKIRWVT
jgi:hypothetical protein